jgi:5,10-methylene-tetrahydrofolate dehydrogenase/methenyl tetrahydrofolate cyclohydrolase
MIIDGKQIAAEILARMKVRAAKLPCPPRMVALVGEETAATKSYLKIKTARAADAGCLFETRELNADFQDADAVIAQLPLPSGVDTKKILDFIPIEKDADVLSSVARAKFENGEADVLLPPVVGAVAEILKRGSVELKNKKAVVIGNGFLVGAPVATWLRQQDAEVVVLDITTPPEEFTAALGNADIVVSGAGSPHFIKPEMIKDGIVLIDAGTSESSGKVVGDADPSCASKCSLFTPVPGGVGPIAVAKLFENAVLLAERKSFTS